VTTDWFFGIYNQQEIQRLFTQAKPGDYCVHWDMIEKVFILSGLPKADKVATLKQWPLKSTSIVALQTEMSSSDLISRNLKQVLSPKPETFKTFKLKEVFASSGTSDYAINANGVKNNHYTFVK